MTDIDILSVHTDTYVRVRQGISADAQYIDVDVDYAVYEFWAEIRSKTSG